MNPITLHSDKNNFTNKNAKSEIKTGFPNGLFEAITMYKSKKVAFLKQRNTAVQKEHKGRVQGYFSFFFHLSQTK